MEPASINGEELLLRRPTSQAAGHSLRVGPRLVDRDGPFGQSCERDLMFQFQLCMWVCRGYAALFEVAG